LEKTMPDRGIRCQGTYDTGTTGDVANATNAAATVTYAAAGAGKYNVITGVAWSYSAAPTGGNLQIADGANVLLNIDITAAGPGFFMFPTPKKGSNNTALTLTLAAGGAGVVGRLSVLGAWVETLP
jgi:hypothetical protein